jgi:glycosyltransferase involved in cell wall biosynthesis
MSASFIFYTNNHKYLKKTIDGLIDHTPRQFIVEIIVCNDTSEDIEIDGVRVIKTDRIGKASAWNKAIKEAQGDKIVLLGSDTKFSYDWYEPIDNILNKEPQSLVSPIVYQLDSSLWSSEPVRMRRFGWRWDLELYDRQDFGKQESPAVSSYCIAAKKQWLLDIGLFDSGMDGGSGEDIELSIRNWMLGGQIFVSDDSSISCVYDRKASEINKLRTVELWLKKYESNFYDAVKCDNVDTGRLDNLSEFKDKQIQTIEWFLETFQPELYKVHRLRNIATGKRIAVLASGSSLDHISNGLINSYDIIIGTDYTGLIFDCDYVMTDSMVVANELRDIYEPNKFVLPNALENRAAGQYSDTSDVITGTYIYERAVQGHLSNSVNPPFINFENIVLDALHFALFMNPKDITLFGFDTKLLDGKSHTTKISYYDDGKILTDSEATKRNYSYFDYGLSHLSKLAIKLKIPLLRFNHA